MAVRARSSTATATCAGWPRRSEPAPSAATESILSGSATTQARRSVTSRSSGMVRGGLGAGLVDVPTVPYRDPSSAIMAGPAGRRVPALLRPLRRAGRARARRRPGTHGGLLPQVRHAVLVRAQARRGRPRRRPVRGRRLPRARRPRLDLPGARPQRVRPLGGAQGPAEHRRRRRDGRRARRATLPGRGRAPEHRQDPQLRRAPALGLHRHGVRRRHEPEGAATDEGRRRGRDRRRCPSRRRSPTCSRSCRRSATCTARACSTATSSPTTSSRHRTR